MKPINWKRILLVSLITIIGMYIYLLQTVPKKDTISIEIKEEVAEEVKEPATEMKIEEVEVVEVVKKTPEPVAVRLVVEAEEPSRYDQLQMIADSLFQTIPSTSWQARFNEIVTFQDRALSVATKMHPDPNDFMERREAEIVLDERYTKMWAEAKFDWYKELDLPEDEKYTILYSIRSKIAGIGVRNGWLDELDKK